MLTNQLSNRMATDHVDDFNYSPYLDSYTGLNDVSFEQDGDLHDELFEGDINHYVPSIDFDEQTEIEPVTASSLHSFEDSSPGFEERPISWASSFDSEGFNSYQGSNSYTDSWNDRTTTQSWDPFNPEHHFYPTALTDDLSGIEGNPLLEETISERSANANASPIAIPDHISSTVQGPASQSSSLDVVQYEFNPRSRRVVSRNGSLNGKKTRGRKRGLSPATRKNAALMRVIGSCTNCKRRKEKCDPGTPCRSCVLHFKGNLVNNPCRGKTLESLTEYLLNNQVGWHPTERSLDTFLVQDRYDIGQRVLNVPLSLGFGPTLDLKAQVVFPTDVSTLYHTHSVYAWPPQSHGAHSSREIHDVVFPAVLTDTSDLRNALDRHLSLLVDQYFRSFPLFCSPFHILRDIYIYYKGLPKHQATILHQALKLLVLVHVGDIVRVPADSDVVQAILDLVFYSVPSDTEVRPTPCFIRGQLGSVIPSLAESLLRSILGQLERLSLSRECNNWPTIVAVTALLLMTVESVQYHAAKKPYHLHSQSSHSSHAVDIPGSEQQMPKPDEDAANQLLHFYRVCYSGCHERLNGGCVECEEGPPCDPPERFLSSLREAVGKARPYLEERSHLPIEKDDMSCYFDRLLARLFLGQNTV